MNRTQAIGRAALVRALVNGLERRVQEGIDGASDAGAPAAAAKLTDAQALIEQAHVALTEAAALIAAHFGEADASAFSGGDDKPPQR